ncbi:nSTAND1 domain-containing NTPase [Allokutzneria albata]|uniref:WD40 repeat n=1 Tax=Allokutzneria albata TaxID=211114 RepID=A0A1G9XYC4_ALLAB|nr:helix-turn-helix domain-containing protein [Allokutzneria albata]SDN01165.1 WD40 repeat [Allokutzneria albata]
MPRPERPLAEDDSAVARFAAALRELRESAGSPGYRELAKRAHYSVTTLSEAAGGRKLPSLAVALAYAEACGGDRAEWERRWREAEAESLGDAVEPGKDSPYRGLAAFREQDAELFFGREELVADLLDRLGRDRFLVVAGASGAGKSSLLRAGVAHRVATEGLAGRTDWRAVVLVPGTKPLTTWTERLADAIGDVPGDVDARAALSEEPTALPRLVELADVSLLVVIDQFEETFAAEVAEEERAAFLAAVLAARHTRRLRVVLGVRADYLGHCSRHPGLVDAMRDRHVLVGPMTVPELRTAITEPAARTGCTVETALLATLVAEAANEQGGLPLVSHALLETWRRRRGRVLTLSGYEAAGGIRDAVVRTAEAVYARLSEDEAVTARALFLRLVDASEGILRRRVASAELDRENPLNAGVLDAFAAARLLTVDEGAVEIAHEALISSWPRLTGWIAEDREGHRVHQRLAVAAADWNELGRDPSALYRGTRLAVAREWAAGDKVVLSSSEKDFLDASNTTEQAELGLQARRTRQLRQLVAGLAIALVVAVVAGLIVLKQRQDAIDLQQLALSRQLAAEANAVAARDPLAAMRKALDAHATARTEEARSVLLSLASYQANHGLIPRDMRNEPAGAFSPDGSLFAIADGYGVAVWDTRTLAKRLTLVVEGQLLDVNAVAFSRDGARVIAVDAEGRAVTWAVGSGALVANVTGPITGKPLLLSSGGDLMITRGKDAAGVAVWRVDGRQLLHTLLQDVSADHVHVAFSRDGQALFTADHTGRAAKWDARTGGKLAEVKLDKGPLFGIEPAEDGVGVAVGAKDGQLLHWDVRSGQVRSAGTPMRGGIGHLAFFSGGGMLATSGDNGTVALWRTDDLRELVRMPLPRDSGIWRIFSGSGGVIGVVVHDSVVFLRADRLPLLGQDRLGEASLGVRADGTVLSAGNERLLTWSPGRPVDPSRVEFAEPARLTPAQQSAFALVISSLQPLLSPDQRVVVVPAGNKISLVDPATGRAVGSLSAPTSTGFRRVAVSADGSRLAAAHDDSVTVWDLADRRVVTTVPGATFTFALSPDGRRLAWNAEDGLKLANVDGTPVPRQLNDHDTKGGGAIWFSQDGTALAHSEHNAVTLWDTTTGASRGRVAAGRSLTDSLAFSPDGRLVATGHSTGEVLVSEVASGRLITSLRGHRNTVDALAWRPDSAALATGGWDGEVIVWELRPERAVTTLCRFLGEAGRADLPRSCAK